MCNMLKDEKFLNIYLNEKLDVTQKHRFLLLGLHFQANDELFLTLDECLLVGATKAEVEYLVDQVQKIEHSFFSRHLDLEKDCDVLTSPHINSLKLRDMQKENDETYKLVIDFETVNIKKKNEKYLHWLPTINHQKTNEVIVISDADFEKIKKTYSNIDIESFLVEFKQTLNVTGIDNYKTNRQVYIAFESALRKESRKLLSKATLTLSDLPLCL